MGFSKALFFGAGMILCNMRGGGESPFLLDDKQDVSEELDDIVLVSAKIKSHEISFENILEIFILFFTQVFDRSKANILITQEFIKNIPKQRVGNVGNTASGFHFSLGSLGEFSRHQIYWLKKYHIAYYTMVLLDVLNVKKRPGSKIVEDFIFSYLPKREDGCTATYSITRDALVFAISKGSDGYCVDVTVNKAMFDLDRVVFFLRQFSVECDVLDI
ncbi:hypothetical protein MO867_17865 [Microbulbifer sp. OS29]|uniref:Uncharacterized protein n=1 Tax=Microbulbifer okhotskensis TaxID=2926617 RepID=A0A9X2ERS8_9GAMM|nr:hypothetical protein [Microbulbifer okhotskensis]MCO1336200.1 hypothetical protein [Microbulbifer okhotskensis]